MSKNELENFIYSSEHSYSLRRELKKNLTNKEDLIKLANRYGFKISLEDFEKQEFRDRINNWFIKSRINPISQ